MRKKIKFKYIKFDDVLRAFGIIDSDKKYAKHWNFTQKTFDNSNIFFLNSDYIKNICEMLGISSEIEIALQKTAIKIKKNHLLSALAWHCYLVSFPKDEVPKVKPSDWPKISKETIKEFGLFYALIFFSGIPWLLEKNLRKGIANEITIDTLKDLETKIIEHKNKNGLLGLDKIFWFSKHFSSELFKIGRLQYAFHHFEFDFYSFYNNTTKQIIVFAGDKSHFNKDGRFEKTNVVSNNTENWVSHFKRAKSKICGYPVSAATGTVNLKCVELLRSKWKFILKKGDPTLAIHIPATGKMDYNECGESLKQAKNFYATHFPNYTFNAFQCVSWLLDYQFKHYLLPSSNICLFLREFYLFPIPEAAEYSTIYTAFGKKVIDVDANPPRIDISKAKPKTSLQAGIIKHLKSGQNWYSGGGLIFPHNFNWGAPLNKKFYSNE